jgi:hypothetical protein
LQYSMDISLLKEKGIQYLSYRTGKDTSTGA